ncbi:LOW QUALITY PROTEIN: DBF4-type zinc finger-containing protein 2-like [Salarias fasciatus]|uniref:LOW QUALITY PROTEIN: DBF4-type zinc finger-containing protein 2-like n=1 Tax=Salarias fasciatus TaxID=181472 RepID=UPI001177057F|nr:LOW QUALITY PROTEIN: DBF4-type zinc finger-containing protein 2-like [Salarias fasciatus]
MSDSSAADDQRRTETNTRMWAESEPEPGPSQCETHRHGYCSYCRVMYVNLDQHLSSLRHLDSVKSSSRGTASVSSISSTSSRTKLTLLKRFLQDVMQHHPHRYNDPRPSHADLPMVSTPLLPRAAVDEPHFSDDSRSAGTPKQLPSSDEASNQQEELDICTQSGNKANDPPRRRGRGGSVPPARGQVPDPQPQDTPPIHRKAHRKTNRRKTSESSSSSQPAKGPNLKPDPGAGTRPSPGNRPWEVWQKERRDLFKEEAFSNHSELMDQTIEEVVQRCCYGDSREVKEETESFHFSLPASAETQSENWDSSAQVVFQQSRVDAPAQATQTEGRDLSQLTDCQVDLENQGYSNQLDCALKGERRPNAEAALEQGFWGLPIEDVLPAPQHIPDSFRGKTWAQIEQEDEQRVDRLVRQFRRGHFICYFDSESLARYGRRSPNKKQQDEAPEEDSAMMPLMDHDDHDSVEERRRRRKTRKPQEKKKHFRLASRCQVVKVSHGTQTVPLASPEATPSTAASANRDAAQTPEAPTWRCLPPTYSTIISPVQPRTSTVYLLSSPAGPAPSRKRAAACPLKYCRKRRRPLDLQGLKVKYRSVPVRLYEPGTNRILKAAPRRDSAPSDTPPAFVRQLFGSLSPDLNAPGVNGQRSADHDPDAQTDGVRRLGATAETSPISSRSGQSRGTRPPPAKRPTRRAGQEGAGL